MPVLTMNEPSWDNKQGMLTNGQADMAGARQNTISSNRSQDDATVGYFFQRPQSESELSNYTNKRWAVGDDSCIIEQVSQ